MHLMRSPPGDPSSLELCIDAALGPVEDFADTAIMVADKLNALDPNISKAFVSANAYHTMLTS